MRETFRVRKRGLRNVSGNGLLGMLPESLPVDHYHITCRLAGQASDFWLSQSARVEGVQWHTHQNNGCLILRGLMLTNNVNTRSLTMLQMSNYRPLLTLLACNRYQQYITTFSSIGTSTPYAILQYSRVSQSSFQPDALQILFRIFQQETVSRVSKSSHTASAQSWVLTYTTRSSVRQYPNATEHGHRAYPTKAGNRTALDSLPI